MKLIQKKKRESERDDFGEKVFFFLDGNNEAIERSIQTKLARDLKHLFFTNLKKC